MYGGERGICMMMEREISSKREKENVRKKKRDGQSAGRGGGDV